MQLLIDIENDAFVDKIIKILEVFKNDGVKIKKQITSKTSNEIIYDDEYIEKHWKDVVSKALASYDETYENSFQYKIDRANFQDLKGNM